MRLSNKTILSGVVLVAVVLAVSAGPYLAKYPGSQPKLGQAPVALAAVQTQAGADDNGSKTVELNETQLKSVKVEQAGERTFVIQRGGSWQYRL